jgi:methionine-S-sulfoxide reductase|tara:strand:+ start:643 stop:1272 length:630 start_codon:yes stop_codon:yes gene_type:complete
MKKLLVTMIFFFNVIYIPSSTLAGKLTATIEEPEKIKITTYKKAYFAGGCFWCMEESFDQVEGVVKTISGYSGGKLKNPTYKDVIYKDTGHVEAIEVTYDSKIVTYKKLLDIYWQNIDPFDEIGQFCDKGKSYRSVIFFQNKKQKTIINNSLKKVEKRFNSKVYTLIWNYEKFYKAEDYHQNYYQKNFLNYLAYKKGCQRKEVLDKIWN